MRLLIFIAQAFAFVEEPVFVKGAEEIAGVQHHGLRQSLFVITEPIELGHIQPTGRSGIPLNRFSIADPPGPIGIGRRQRALQVTQVFSAVIQRVSMAAELNSLNVAIYENVAFPEIENCG